MRREGTRQRLAFLRRQVESQSDWEGLLQDLYRRGWEGQRLGLIMTDGCPRLAAAIATVYPRGRHQRCWMHKMRNILEKVGKRDYDEAQAGAQAVCSAESRAQAEAAFPGSGRGGTGNMGRWCDDSNATCQSCCRSSPSPGTCGGNSARPT